jgi:hypothetical protein
MLRNPGEEVNADGVSGDGRARDVECTSCRLVWVGMQAEAISELACEAEEAGPSFLRSLFFSYERLVVSWYLQC